MRKTDPPDNPDQPFQLEHKDETGMPPNREEHSPPSTSHNSDKPLEYDHDKDHDSGKEKIFKTIGQQYHQKREKATEEETVKSEISSLLNEKQHPLVRPLSEADLQDVYKTFVVPDGFPDIDICLSHHIIIIRGEEDSGKYAAARYLAYQLLSDGYLENVYYIPDNVGMSLQTLARRYPKSLLIARDAFSTENAFLFRSTMGVGGKKIGTPQERRALLDLLDQRFDREEVRDLCLSLGVNYENLGGEGKRAKVRALIEYLDRHARIVELIRVGKKTRPDINWGAAYDFAAKLRTNLLASSSYLIITTVGQNKQIKQVLDLFSIDDVPEYHYPSPDLYQVFVKHLQARLGKTDAETWLMQYDAMIIKMLPQWRHPKQAVDMAQKALSPDQELPENIQARFREVSANSEDINTEIKQFFKSLDDEHKMLSLTLSMLTSWPESDFWHMHSQLTPAFLEVTSQKTSKKRKKRKKQQKEASIFGTPKTEMLQAIRAHVTPVLVQLGSEKHIIPHIEFKNEEYPQKIQDYVKRNHPDFLENMITHLVSLAEETKDNRAIRIAATEGVGLLSRVRWPYVENILREWANHSAPYVRAMAGHVLSKAYTDPETRIYSTTLLRHWEKSDVPELQWTAVSTYKEMRWIDLDFGLDGLERLAYRLDISPLKTLMPFESHLMLLDEKQFGEYILRQAGVRFRRTDPREIDVQVGNYLATVTEKETTWANIKPVFDAIAFAIVVIALDNYLKDVIYLLCDWVNETEYSEKTTIQLAGSLIWLHLANVMAKIADKNKTENGILDLISQDEDALDAVAEMLSGSFVQLFPIQLANHRKSFEVYLLLEQWVKTTKHIDTMNKLLHRMGTYLAVHPKIHRYVRQLFHKRWQSQKMSKNIRELALAITQ